MYVCM
jgi:hypothetical protein